MAIDSIKILRTQRGTAQLPMATFPGCYRWWFFEDEAIALLNKINFSPTFYHLIQKQIINGKSYWCLYCGISKNLKNRFVWHVFQKHTDSTVKHGALSTLRQTLSALLGASMSHAECLVNQFMDSYCYFEYDNVETHTQAEVWEKSELQSQEYAYPLNIQGNISLRKIAPDVIKTLKSLRKQYNK